MRLRINDPPTNGETRIRTLFLWLPKNILNELMWLEIVKIKEIFHRDYVNYEDSVSYCWTVIEEIQDVN